jgi:hypothetical protein
MSKKHKFIITEEAYMCEDGDTSSVMAKDLKEVLIKQFGTSSVKECKDANGDGQPYVTIFDTKKDKKVFG